MNGWGLISNFLPLQFGLSKIYGSEAIGYMAFLVQIVIMKAFYNRCLYGRLCEPSPAARFLYTIWSQP